MRTAASWAALALAGLALAGCAGEGHEEVPPVTCPDGTVVDPEADEGHHAAGFDPASACPVAPSVRLEGVPATLQAYRTATFSWTLDNGSHEGAHSMLTSVRVSTSSVPDGELGPPESYGSELARHEHQDLPVTYQASLQLSQEATVYLRAYATIDGQDHWSPEATLRVLPVTPTGVEVQVTHAPGGPLGEVAPAEVQLQLGDAVVFVNEDLVPHTFTFTSGPGAPGPVEVEAMSQSAAIPLLVPGTYGVETDDVQPQAVEIRVAVPA